MGPKVLNSCTGIMIHRLLVFPKYWTNVAYHQQCLSYPAFVTNGTVRHCGLYLIHFHWVSAMWSNPKILCRELRVRGRRLVYWHRFQCCFTVLVTCEGGHHSVLLGCLSLQSWEPLICIIFFPCTTWVRNVKSHKTPCSFDFPPTSHVTSRVLGCVSLEITALSPPHKECTHD